jgi:hypothetical protein
MNESLIKELENLNGIPSVIKKCCSIIRQEIKSDKDQDIFSK